MYCSYRLFCNLDSSHIEGSHSGTLGKDRGNKGRKKWVGILGVKHKHSSRHDEDIVDGFRGLHDTLPKHPLPTTISKEAMVSTSIWKKFCPFNNYFE